MLNDRQATVTTAATMRPDARDIARMVSVPTVIRYLG
jgi:hypothetical protein